MNKAYGISDSARLLTHIINGLGRSTLQARCSPCVFAIRRNHSLTNTNRANKSFTLPLWTISTKIGETRQCQLAYPSGSKAPDRYLIRAYSSVNIKDSDSTTVGKTEQKMEPEFIVGHDKSKKCFYIKLHDKTGVKHDALAMLEYKWVRPGLVDLYHTEVPPEFRGQGIAQHLAKAAFDTFCEQDALIRPTCTYLQKYLRDNPVQRYLDRVEAGCL